MSIDQELAEFVSARANEQILRVAADAAAKQTIADIYRDPVVTADQQYAFGLALKAFANTDNTHPDFQERWKM